LFDTEVDNAKIKISEERFERYMSFAIQSFENIMDLEYMDTEKRRYFVDEDELITFENNVLQGYELVEWVETDSDHVYMLVVKDPLSGNDISEYVFFPQYRMNRHSLLYFNGVRLEGDQRFVGLK
jgi:hypothetical protein